MPGATVAEPAESTSGRLMALPVAEPTRLKVRSNSMGAAMAMAMPAVSPRVLIAVGALRVT